MLYVRAFARSEDRLIRPRLVIRGFLLVAGVAYGRHASFYNLIAIYSLPDMRAHIGIRRSRLQFAGSIVVRWIHELAAAQRNIYPTARDMPCSNNYGRLKGG
jgi:hypothetical protein